MNNITTQEQIDEAIKNWEFIRLQEVMAHKNVPTKSEYGPQLDMFEEESRDMLKGIVHKKLLAVLDEELKHEKNLNRSFIPTVSKSVQKCPVCQGVGTVHHNFYDQFIQEQTYHTYTGPTICRTCNGVGVLWG